MDEDLTSDVKSGQNPPSESSTEDTIPGLEPEDSSGQDVKTAGDKTDDTTTDKPGSGDEQPKSKAAQRIGELIRENKALKAQLEGTDEEETPATVTPASPVAENTPELGRAKTFLKNLGFAPTEELRQVMKDEVEKMEARLILDQEKSRLETTYDGTDGRPRYDHDKVMAHARSTGIYNPEVAYKNMYEAELMDWAIKNAQGTGATFTEKPTTSAAPETGQLTRESLARILATPDGRKWYNENREKVLSALQKGEL